MAWRRSSQSERRADGGCGTGGTDRVRPGARLRDDVRHEAGRVVGDALPGLRGRAGGRDEAGGECGGAGGRAVPLDDQRIQPGLTHRQGCH